MMQPRARWLAAFCLLAVTGACLPPAPPAVREIDSPAAPGSAEPDLAAGADGGLYLSWIEPDADGHALRFSRLRGDAWSAPRTIATGDEWFVNWADFPSLAAAADGRLAAHWLVRSGESTYAYAVRASVSEDGGRSWAEPVEVHPDGTATEHGFVTLVPRDDGGFSVVWLDGRHMDPEYTERGDHPPAMTLRHAVLDRGAEVRDELLLDEQVCECCATDAVLTEGGALVVAYRDRTADEIRDIYVIRMTDGSVSQPVRVHADGWEIAGCPVNGPALAADGERVAIAWFTAAGETARVLTALSDDGGVNFGAPVRLDGGDPLGRVDVVFLESGSVLVSWLEKHGERAEIRLRELRNDGELRPAVTVATTSGARASGFPRLARDAGRTIIAWTEPGEPSRVRTAVWVGD